MHHYLLIVSALFVGQAGEPRPEGNAADAASRGPTVVFYEKPREDSAGPELSSNPPSLLTIAFEDAAENPPKESAAEKQADQPPIHFQPPAPPVLPAPLAPPPPTPPDRWFLMRELQGTWYGAMLDDNRLQVSGWTDQSFTASTDRFEQLPMGFNYLANQYLLQQNWLRIERTVVTSGTTEPTFGFRSDTILPGSDYRFTLARGLFSGQLTANDGTPNTYGIDPIQFYGEAYFPTVARGLDIKVGHFYAIYGVESNEAISNQLGSHAYTFIYNPFTHTGVLATVKLNDAWTTQLAVVTGSDIFIDSADEPTFTGNVKWTRPDNRDSVQASVIVGPGRFNQERNFHNPEVFDLIYVHKFTPRLTYSFEGLYGFTTNVPDTGFANWLGIIHYLTRDLTPRVSTTVRLEFFDDFQGQRTGSPGLYTALTAGLNIRPRSDIIFRPELRYDYNNESHPFEGKHGLFTADFDLIFRW